MERTEVSSGYVTTCVWTASDAPLSKNVDKETAITACDNAVVPTGTARTVTDGHMWTASTPRAVGSAAALRAKLFPTTLPTMRERTASHLLQADH